MSEQKDGLAQDENTSSDGRLRAGGMQMPATEGAITQRPAHPMDTISGGPVGPSDPEVIIAGIRQFGLAPDGSDLRDLLSAVLRLRTPAASDALGLLRVTQKQYGADAALEHAAEEIARLTAQVEDARDAIAPFSKMAASMYISGHCGGASPEYWPDTWHVGIEGRDRKGNIYVPQQWGGSLTVGDFRKLSTALTSTERQDG